MVASVRPSSIAMRVEKVMALVIPALSAGWLEPYQVVPESSTAVADPQPAAEAADWAGHQFQAISVVVSSELPMVVSTYQDPAVVLKSVARVVDHPTRAAVSASVGSAKVRTAVWVSPSVLAMSVTALRAS